ncbi:hypothetical protein ACE41H_20170 [Paenibacillus enshidis]|uniref:Uncharacterized protein n=1 Tax=Paenibacillus enshidis TaxID=1458439 RepID=A0ABV5AXZ3_9BACL
MAEVAVHGCGDSGALTDCVTGSVWVSMNEDIGNIRVQATTRTRAFYVFGSLLLSLVLNSVTTGIFRASVGSVIFFNVPKVFSAAGSLFFVPDPTG